MSVVERAIDKLRRAGGAEGAATAAQPGSETIATLVLPEHASEQGSRVAVNREALRAAGYLPEQEQDRRFADEYRQIKRPVLARAFSKDAANQKPSPRLVMMASALPGDGKTFTSINLALSLARERDSSVVLVDADVAKPHISRIFGVEGEPGLLDALADDSIEIGSLILPTDVRGLAILPAGAIRDGATELLASHRMEQITAGILARHPRCVALFDSPPIVISSEARSLVNAMGQVIIVVRAGRTPRNALLEAVEAVGKKDSVSLVLNQGRRNLLEGMYGYSYGSYGDREAE
jgi:exopolysaccharide/PEP-CTERM locus tyrosine autokinase